MLQFIIDMGDPRKRYKEYLDFIQKHPKYLGTKGNYKKGSDIDIAILADELSFDELNQIKVNVNEFMLPYNIDLIDFNKITDIALRDHILRVGKVIDA